MLYNENYYSATFVHIQIYNHAEMEQVLFQSFRHLVIKEWLHFIFFAQDYAKSDSSIYIWNP